MIQAIPEILVYWLKRCAPYLVYVALLLFFVLLWRKAGVKVFSITLGGVLVLFILLVFLGQEWVIYSPRSEVESTPADVGLSYQEEMLTTSDGESIYAWFVPGDEEKPVVLFCHGNASTVSDESHLKLLQVLNDLGFSSIVFDYRGFGKSSGSPGEKGTYRDVEAVWDYLVNSRGYEPSEIAIWGKSLGGGVASYLASQRPGARALVLECTFTSVPDVAWQYAPLFPPEWVIRHEYPVKDYVQQVRSPILVAHSPEDEVIPYTLGRKIYEAAAEPKRFIELRGSHVWGFWTSRDVFVPAIEDFIVNPP